MSMHLNVRHLQLFTLIVCMSVTFSHASHLTCSLCEPGSFCFQDGSVLCPAHSSSPAGSKNVSDCVCDAGYFEEANLCESCPAGFFCAGVDETKVRCPAHSTSPEFSDSVGDCTCEQGFYGDSSAGCSACPVGTFKAVGGSGPCVDCPADSYSDRTNRSSSCDPCPAHTVSPAGSDAEGDCVAAPGYFTAGSVQPCPPGTFQDLSGQTDCKLCGGLGFNAYYSITVASTSNTSCITCPAHSHVVGSSSGTERGDCVCDDGYSGPNGGPCVACPSGTYKDNSVLDPIYPNQCSPCPGNTYLDTQAAVSVDLCLPCMHNASSAEGSTSIQQCKCDPGFKLSGIVCVGCSSGTIQNGSDDSQCVQCPAGTYEDGHISCVACPEFTNAPRGSTVCTCNAGYEESTGSCRECAHGHYNPGQNSSCQPCPLSTWSGITASVACQPCPENSASTVTGMTSVQGCVCDGGYAGDSGVCSLCPAGTYHATTTTTCFDCLAGKYTASGGATSCVSCGLRANSDDGATTCLCDPAYTRSGDLCMPCAAGSFKNSSGNQTCSPCASGHYSLSAADACSVCPADTYQDTEKSTGCKSCPPHSVSLPGSTAAGDCRCLPGFSSVDGECVACGYGEYKTTTANEACQTCATGYYTLAPGAAADSLCLLCTHDSYVSAGMCVQCVANAEADEGSASIGDCHCLPGFSGSAETGGSCEPCPQGHFKAINGDAACEECPPGSVGGTVLPRSSLAACQACPPNSFKLNSTHCAACSTGSSSPTGSASSKNCTCDPGFSGDAFSGGLCVPCSAGEFKNWSGSGECAMCPRGKYNGATGASSPSACESCPDHTTQLSPPPYTSAFECQCVAGYGVAQGACELCPPGSFKEAGQYACQECPAASYYPASEAAPFVLDLCRACPGNSSSLAGSYGVTQCNCLAGFLRRLSADSMTCEPCSVDSYCPTQDTLLPCPDAKSSPAMASSVAECTCDPGYHGPAGAGPCEVCPVNHFCVGGEGLEACSANASTLTRTRQTNVTACQCSPGFYESLEGTCKLCPADSYCSRDKITACPPNSTAVAQATSVDMCLCDATFRRSGEECEPCPATVLCIGGGEEPLPCASDALVSRQQCRCAPGTFCADTSADGNCFADSACEACPADHWCIDNGRHECPTGMGSPPGSTGQSNCTCFEGTFHVGDVCQVCPFNSYCTGGQQLLCSDFDPHLMTISDGRSRLDQCQCDYGFFRVDRQDACKPCPKNFYCPHESLLALPNVVACGENEHTLAERSYQSGSCICDAGFLFTEDGDSMKCTACAEGERCQHGFVVEFMCHLLQRTPNDDHTKCVCLPSFGEYELECVLCRPGSVKPDKGDYACQFCPINTFWRNTTLCNPCPAHSSSPPGSLTCTCEAPFVMQDGICKLCEADHYYDQGACEPCPGNSSSPPGAPDILGCVCHAGHYRSTSSNGTSCKQCPPGTFELDGVCRACGAGAISPAGNSDPRACVCNASACQLAVWGWDCEGSCERSPEPCSQCAPGFFKDTVSLPGNTDKCDACGVAKYQSDFGASACQTCAPTESHFLLAQTNVSSCECVPGFEPSGNASAPCRPCAPGFFKSNRGDVACTPCAVGSFASGEASIVCTSCSVARSSSPQFTGANTTLGSNSTALSDCTCTAGLYLSENGNTSRCVPCVPGSFKASKGSHGCTFCGSLQAHAGTTYENHHGSLLSGATSDTHCSPCPQFSGQNASLVAPSGFVLDEWSDCMCFGGYHNLTFETCTHCPQYMFKVGFSAEPCAYCANGSFFTTNFQECVVCELRDTEGTLHTANSINRLDPALEWGLDRDDCSCSLGYERIADTCNPCPLGKFRGSRAVRYCGICAEDTYTNTTASLQCSACPTHSTTLGRNGTTAVTGCTCDAGFQWNAETLGCDACPPGTFRTDQDVLQETLSCVACPADHYPNPTNTECVNCPSNERSDAGSPSLDHCNCRPGYGNNSSPGACSPCPNGTYSKGGDQAGNRHPTCAACPAHKNSSVRSDAVGDCRCVPGYGTRAPSILNLVWDFASLPEDHVQWIAYAESIGGSAYLDTSHYLHWDGVSTLYDKGYVRLPLPNAYTTATVQFRMGSFSAGQALCLLNGVEIARSGGQLTIHTFDYGPNSILKIEEHNYASIADLKVTFPPIIEYASSSDPCIPCADGKYSVGGHLEPCSACGWGAISEPPLAATNFDACLCNAAMGVYEA